MNGPNLSPEIGNEGKRVECWSRKWTQIVFFKKGETFSLASPIEKSWPMEILLGHFSAKTLLSFDYEISNVSSRITFIYFIISKRYKQIVYTSM